MTSSLRDLKVYTTYPHGCSYLDGQEALRHNCCVDQLETTTGDDYLSFAARLGNEESFLSRRILAGQGRVEDEP